MLNQLFLLLLTQIDIEGGCMFLSFFYTKLYTYLSILFVYTEIAYS